MKFVCISIYCLSALSLHIESTDSMIFVIQYQLPLCSYSTDGNGTFTNKFRNSSMLCYYYNASLGLFFMYPTLHYNILYLHYITV